MVSTNSLAATPGATTASRSIASAARPRCSASATEWNSRSASRASPSWSSAWPEGVTLFLHFIPFEELKLLDKATDDYLVNNLHRDFKKRFEKHLKSTRKSRESKGREIYISNLAVAEGYKSLEIVTKLVEAVEEKGYLLGYDKICLTTNDIKFMELYKTLNFVIEEEEFFDHMISFRMVKYL